NDLVVGSSSERSHPKSASDRGTRRAPTRLDQFRTSVRKGPPICCILRSMNAPAALIDLLFVIAPHSLLLDIAGPAEAFRLANLHRARRGLPPRFHLRFTSHAPKALTSVGLPLASLQP